MKKLIIPFNKIRNKKCNKSKFKQFNNYLSQNIQLRKSKLKIKICK